MWVLDYLKYAVSPILIFVCTIALNKAVSYLLAKHRQKLEERDKTQFTLIRRTVTAIIYLIGGLSILYSIPPLKGWATSLFASAGLVAIAIGFAAQDAFKNIVAGFFIVIFRPFRIGDRVTYNNITGIVEDINLRQTILTTGDNNRVIIPNANITSADITNYTITDQRILKSIDFGISYNSDIDKARKIIIEECLYHPNCFNKQIHETKQYLHEILKNTYDMCFDKCEEPIQVKVVEWGDSAIKLRTWLWTENPVTAFHLSADILESVKKRFDKEGIEIPYPHRTIVYKTEKNLKT